MYLPQTPGGMPPMGGNPQDSLEELKRRLSQAQDVVVDSSGALHVPNPGVPGAAPQSNDKTVLKPQRWFGKV